MSKKVNRYWFGLVANWDYMCTFATIVEAESLDDAFSIIRKRYPNCTIEKCAIMSDLI